MDVAEYFDFVRAGLCRSESFDQDSVRSADVDVASSNTNDHGGGNTRRIRLDAD
jgi:hypothetical protein